MADMLELQFGITSQDVDDARAEAERSRRAAVIAQSIASGSQLFLDRPPARIIRPGHCRHNKIEGRCVVRLSRPSCCGGVCVCVLVRGLVLLITTWFGHRSAAEASSARIIA
jgi:hypothetical protein